MRPMLPLFMHVLLFLLFFPPFLFIAKSARKFSLHSTELNFKTSSNLDASDSRFLNLSISVITWNLAERSIKEFDTAFLLGYRGNDMIILGVQEIEDIKPRRNPGHRTRNWAKFCEKQLGNEFKLVGQHKMGGMQIAIYCKKHLAASIEGLLCIDISCGVANILMNKGAVCLALRMRSKTIVFVNAHLAAHQTKVTQRNADYHRIMDSIISQIPSKWRVNKYKIKSEPKARIPTLQPLSGNEIRSLGSGGLTRKRMKNPYDGIIFFGDLNYRVDVTRNEIEEYLNKYNILVRKRVASNNRLQSLSTGDIKKKFRLKISEHVSESDVAQRGWSKELNAILRHDQLNQQRRRKRAFQPFSEGTIDFPPTFKYDIGSNSFDSGPKARCPAWTDRILFSLHNQRSTPGVDKVSNGKTKVCEGVESVVEEPVHPSVLNLKDYYSLDVRASDHRPVCAEFTLHL